MSGSFRGGLMIRTARRAVTVALALAAIAGCASRPDRSVPPVVRIIATDSGFVLPGRIASGITEVRLINRGQLMHEGLFTHFLTRDGSTAAYVESVRAGIDVPTFAEDAGGPGLAAPGDSTTVWMDLVPGHYGVTCWYASHMREGQARDFDVIPSDSRAKPPTADITVRMLDYSYQFEGTWSVGNHRVLVENAGTEAHEFDPYRLEPGQTPADFIHWNESGHRGAAPAIALGGSGTFMPGHRVWLPLTLEPGRYFAFCEMPAKIGGQPHYRMGMVREFEVK
jgi:hypothetical protein